MELVDLTLFDAVCKEGSINRAAARMGMAQAAVSVRIRGLEEELQQPLFLRSRRGVQLTPAGESFLPYVQRCLTLLSEGRQALRSPDPVRVRIGMVSGLAPVIAPAVSRFCASREQTVSVRTGNSHEALAWLLDGTADLAIIASMSVPSGLRSVPVYQGKMLLVTHPDYPLVRRYGNQPVPLRELLSTRLSLTRGTAGSSALLEQLESLHSGTVGSTVQAPPELSRHLALAAGSETVALLTETYVTEDLAHGRLVPLAVEGFDPPTVSAIAVYRSRKQPAPGLQAFLRLLRSESKVP